VETISYSLKRHREDRVRRKQKQAEIEVKLREFEAKLRAELDASPVVAPPATGWGVGVWTANSAVANEPVGCILSLPTIPK
jgi:UTP-glucose-1-phosphate uridylyltransferase